MLFSDTPTPAGERALRDVRYTTLWLDDQQSPTPFESLTKDASCDLLVVGGGFTGLWTAILAKQRDPQRDVVLVDAGRIAEGGSSRNGGFVHASLTHGLSNGVSRYPDEIETLIRLGNANLDAIREFVREYRIDCDWRDSGELEYATQFHEARDIQARVREAQTLGEDQRWLSADQFRSRVNAPHVVGAAFEATSVSMVNPARLAWGLRRVASELGVRMHEFTAVTRMKSGKDSVTVTTPHATITAQRVALGTNAFRSPLSAVRRRVLPVYDYVLATEPLSAEQLQAIGWDGFEGLKGAGNRFHYARRTADNRILWGGYDAVYHWGNKVGPELERDHAMFAKLSSHFLTMFPQLAGIRFTHAWGGAIDTCSRFIPFWVHRGPVAAVAGFTGLGVGSSRFAAGVMLDLLDGNNSEATRLEIVRTLPMPFPPEPFRTVVVALTRWSLARADARGGKRNLWLWLLDRLGLGFDS